MFLAYLRGIETMYWSVCQNTHMLFLAYLRGIETEAA